MRLLAATSMAATSLAALMYSGAASAQSAYFNVSQSEVDVSGGGSVGATEISGAALMPLRGTLDFQVDAHAIDVEHSADSRFGATFHVAGRGQGWMLGGFAGVSSVGSADTYLGGAEGALYFGRFTTAGVIAYADTDAFGSNGFIVAPELRYFVTRNLRLDASLGYYNFDTAGSSSDSVAVGVGGEYRFNETPISLFINGSHNDSDAAVIGGDVWRVGLRYNFDRDLADRDEHGASLATYSSLLGVF